MELNGFSCRQGIPFLCGVASPLQDASYLEVNSSNVSSACWSLQRMADWEKARWAVQATGLAR